MIVLWSALAPGYLVLTSSLLTRNCHRTQVKPHENARTELSARIIFGALILLVILGLAACAETSHAPSPGQIYLVRVVDRTALEDAWRRENPARADAAPGVVAFSKTGLICQIWLTPASAMAAFGHEMRHCEEGHWHPER